MDWHNGVVFLCPCEDRQVYIASPPHTITFDDEGVLTLDPSCGYKARSAGRSRNWCHFWVQNGQFKMCEDSKCPGVTLEGGV